MGRPGDPRMEAATDGFCKHVAAGLRVQDGRRYASPANGRFFGGQ